MRTAIVCIAIALTIMVSTAWLFPATPFNGLSLVALILLSVAGISLATNNKGE